MLIENPASAGFFFASNDRLWPKAAIKLILAKGAANNPKETSEFLQPAVSSDSSIIRYTIEKFRKFP